MKRVVILADLHCGHMGGLTPPEKWFAEDDTDHVREKFARLQRIMWGFYKRNIDELKPIDILMVNGDLIDGKGDKSGGTEQITTDRYEQVKIAAQCLSIAEANTVVMAFGTPYHSGEDEDWESVIQDQLEAKEIKIGGHEWYDVNGLVFDMRHHVSRSIVPYGRGTPLMREALWSILWAELAGYPKSDIIVRSHVHYFTYIESLSKVALTTPALQGFTKFGSRRATGLIDIGFIHFDVEGREDWKIGKHLLNLKQIASPALKL